MVHELPYSSHEAISDAGDIVGEVLWLLPEEGQDGPKRRLQGLGLGFDYHELVGVRCS